jgi:long-chain acyl-CoA synthetase
MNIGSLLPRHARYRADHPCLIVDDQTYSYEHFNATVNQLGNALLRAGLKKGDHMTAVLPNCIELMSLYWAAAKTGIVIVPSSTLLQGPGLRTLLEDSDTVVVVADASFRATLDKIRGDLPMIADDGYILANSSSEPPDGYQTFEHFVEGASRDNPPDAELTDTDIYNIMYSSGTTGAPKGIIHTHFVRFIYCTQFATCFRMRPESVVLHAGSIVFNGCMLVLMPWMYLGATFVLHHAFDPKAVIHDIEKFKVTHIVLVPSQIIAILNHPDFNADTLRSLEMILSVGAPLHLEYKQRLNESLPGKFYELYGLTEGFRTILDCTDSTRKAGSVGAPPPFQEMKILRPDGTECEVGEVGEICGRGPMMMPAYYKQPELTAETIFDGWLHSGDAGYVDDEGYLFLVDRIKDMIISGGVNVYPKDIEELIAQHPAVMEVAVFGAPNDKWGEIPIAAIVLNADQSINVDDLIKWTNERVAAKFQRIQDVVMLDEFPRNVAGKTLKREIRETYIKDRNL